MISNPQIKAFKKKKKCNKIFESAVFFAGTCFPLKPTAAPGSLSPRLSPGPRPAAALILTSERDAPLSLQGTLMARARRGRPPPGEAAIGAEHPAQRSAPSASAGRGRRKGRCPLTPTRSQPRSGAGHLRPPPRESAADHGGPPAVAVAGLAAEPAGGQRATPGSRPAGRGPSGGVAAAAGGLRHRGAAARRPAPQEAAAVHGGSLQQGGRRQRHHPRSGAAGGRRGAQL